MKRLLPLAVLCATAGVALGQNVGSYGLGVKPPPPSPETLANLAIPEETQKSVLGKTLPLDGTFYDHTGRAVTLRELIAGKPTILVPVYFNCPKMCGELASNLLKTLRDLRATDKTLVAGEKFNLIMFSFDKKEFPQQAFKKREIFHFEYDGRAPSQEGIWYLSANAGQKTHTVDQAEATILELTTAMKFPFVVPPEDKKGREIQHSTAILVLTPTGMVSSYNTELVLDPKDLRDQIDKAGAGELGTTSGRSALPCFLGSDPTGWYRIAMRILGWVAVPFVLLAFGLVVMTRLKAKRDAALLAEVSKPAV